MFGVFGSVGEGDRLERMERTLGVSEQGEITTMDPVRRRTAVQRRPNGRGPRAKGKEKMVTEGVRARTIMEGLSFERGEFELDIVVGLSGLLL